MPKFKMEIDRTSIRTLTVEIEADNIDSAYYKAHYMARDLDFNESPYCGVEYEVVDGWAIGDEEDSAQLE